MSKYAIFLGAGASASEGGPVQNRLFKDYFLMSNNRGLAAEKWYDNDLATFFLEFFGIDVHNNPDVNFPTFEEAIGMLDLANLKNESFKNFSNIDITDNSGRIHRLRLYLILLMADVLYNKLMQKKDIHDLLVKNLQKNKLINDTIFISTNYDILIDNALSRTYNFLDVDYGLNFRHMDTIGHQDNFNNHPKLLKIHGSLNWLHCTTCNELVLTPFEKGVINLTNDLHEALCQKCESVYSPLIVPPSFYKDMSNIFLGKVWNKAENELKKVEHIIFCGYSFPDADMHIKYLLKRVQMNRRNPSTIKYTIINYHKGKNKAVKEEEKARYKRFLGNGVNYKERTSFEDFAKNPKSVMLN